MPQLAPSAQAVSYSRQETRWAPSSSGINVGAFDDAAGMAAVTGGAFAALGAAFLDDFGNPFARDLGGAFELTGAEVAGRQTAGLIQDVDQNGRTISIQAAIFLGQTVFLDRFSQLPAARP